MLTGLNHVEIQASDAETLVDFLLAVGFEERRRTDHHGRSYEPVPAAGDGPVLEIHTVADEEVPGVNHLAFDVEDLDAATAHLEAIGADGVVGPSRLESTGRRYTNFRDPDGRRLQLVEVGRSTAE